MIDITVQGIPCEFNDNALDDFEMLEKMALMEQGSITALVDFAKGIFGEEQLCNIKDSLRDDGGICRLTAMSGFINQAIVEASKAKRVEPKN